MTKTRVLVVEDEAITAMDIKSCLEELGYDVPGIADTGNEAITLSRLLKPDLIFMDIVLKGKMDGTEAALKITNSSNIPIVFLTAYQDDDTFNRAKLTEPYGYLSKPFEKRDLQITAELALFKHQTAMKLAQSEKRFHNAFTYAATGMALLNTDETFIQVNNALSNMLGYNENELLTNSLSNITHLSDIKIESLHLQRLLVNEEPSFKLEKRFLNKLGNIVWGAVSASLVRDNNQLPLYFIYQVEDISARKLAETQIMHLTHHDALTGLAKRGPLEDFINKSLIEARLSSKQFVVLFLGIDYFKRINDSLGHEAGDLLLQAIGERLCHSISANDFAARLGGDIFVLILTNISELSAAISTVEKIQLSFLKPFFINNQDFHITMSIGISLYPANGNDSQTLIKNADIALHLAKSSGRNNFQFCTPQMTQETLDRVNLENKLHLALEKNQFLLYYQPQVSLVDGSIVGVEALLRWKPDDNAPTLPKALISVAEESGLIIPISAWVLKTACQQAQQWQLAGFKLGSVSINLSARQFYEANLITSIQSVTKEFNVNNLELEITESMLIGDMERAKQQLTYLHDAGFKISLDDFGTGYSSLSYLRQFPITTLKIDQSFVRDSDNSPSNAALLNAIITLGHTLGFTVIAEGVETKEQLKLLYQYGCDLIQGYYYSKPVPAEEVTKLLQNKSLLIHPDKK